MASVTLVSGDEDRLAGGGWRRGAETDLSPVKPLFLLDTRACAPGSFSSVSLHGPPFLLRPFLYPESCSLRRQERRGDRQGEGGVLYPVCGFSHVNRREFQPEKNSDQ